MEQSGSNGGLDIIRLDEPFTFNNEPIGLQCPHCGIVRISDDKIPGQCKHIVFCYDWTNGEYTDICSSFLEYLSQYWNDRDTWESINEYDQDEIELYLNDGEIPTPEFIKDNIQQLQLYEMYSSDGGNGSIWGHASNSLLKMMQTGGDDQ